MSRSGYHTSAAPLRSILGSNSESNSWLVHVACDDHSGLPFQVAYAFLRDWMKTGSNIALLFLSSPWQIPYLLAVYSPCVSIPFLSFLCPVQDPHFLISMSLAHRVTLNASESQLYEGFWFSLKRLFPASQEHLRMYLPPGSWKMSWEVRVTPNPNLSIIQRILLPFPYFGVF